MATSRVDRSEIVIDVRDVHRSFGPNHVLKGINFSVHRGEIVSVLGGSGSGKTTLLKCLIAADRPNKGEIYFGDQEITKLRGKDLDAVKRRFGVLFQSAALFNSMTVFDNIALPLRRNTDLDESTIDIMVKMKLELVGLRDAEDLVPSELSGGMKKRIGLARAVALDPEILFFDEPHAGLDPISIGVIDRLIVDLATKLHITCYIITHEIPSALRISNKIVFLDHGKVHHFGPPDDFRDAEDPLVRQFITGAADGPIPLRKSRKDFAEDILSSWIDRRR